MMFVRLSIMQRMSSMFKILNKDDYDLIKTTDLEVSKCNLSRINDIIIKNDITEEGNCLNTGIEFGGGWTDKVFYIPSLYIGRCNNLTESKYNITCMSNEEFNNKYPGKFF